MEDFDELLAETKKRNMYVLMDLVINHCSDKHEWFKKALANPNGEYADYFYFEKGKNGNPPSNYRSYFGGSVWEPIEGTDKYYLHSFAKEQPDLNWENPKVKKELFKMINWWLDKGLAGFRIDAIINIKKDLAFPNFEPDGDDGLVSITKMVEEVDGVGELLEEMKHKTFEKYNAFTVAEVFNMKEEELPEFIGYNGHFSTMFDFSAHSLTFGEHGWYDSKPIEFTSWRDTIFESQMRCKDIGFLANILENHDEPRGVCRYLPDYALNDVGIKMLATTNILLRGIPFIYQGQEIGMRNCLMNSIDEYNDLESKNQYSIALEAGLSEEEALNACYVNSRDNARTPMQWSSNGNAGFSESNPWIRVNPNYPDINVEAQINDDNSVLKYYQKLIALRKSNEYNEIFTYGDFYPAYLDKDKIFAFYRVLNGRKLLVVANFGQDNTYLELENDKNKVLLSNMEIESSVERILVLKSCEVVVLLIED